MVEWKPFMKKKLSELTPEEQESKRQYYREWDANRKKKPPGETPPKESTKKVLKKSDKSTPKKNGTKPKNGMVAAGDILGHPDVPEGVKEKIRAAQGTTPVTSASPDPYPNKSQSITIPLAGTPDLSRLIEEIRKEQPGAITNNPQTHMQVLVVPQEDGVAVWDITNDLATLNRNMKTLIGVLEKMERSLAILAAAANTTEKK